VDTAYGQTDPLNFTDMKPYKLRLKQAREATGLDEAILNAVGRLGPHAVVMSAMSGALPAAPWLVVGERLPAPWTARLTRSR